MPDWVKYLPSVITTAMAVGTLVFVLARGVMTSQDAAELERRLVLQYYTPMAERVVETNRRLEGTWGEVVRIATEQHQRRATVAEVPELRRQLTELWILRGQLEGLQRAPSELRAELQRLVGETKEETRAAVRELSRRLERECRPRP